MDTILRYTTTGWCVTMDAVGWWGLPDVVDQMMCGGWWWWVDLFGQHLHLTNHSSSGPPHHAVLIIQQQPWYHITCSTVPEYRIHVSTWYLYHGYSSSRYYPHWCIWVSYPLAAMTPLCITEYGALGSMYGVVCIPTALWDCVLCVHMYMSRSARWGWWNSWVW